MDDEPLALQDSVATGAVDCLVVLPAGFEEDLIADARAGRDPAPLEVAYGTDVQAGALAATATSRWVSLAAQAAALEPGATASEVAEVALAVAGRAGRHECGFHGHGGCDGQRASRSTCASRPTPS